MSIGQVESNSSSLPETVELGSNSELDKMAFLELLTVQLANQDPLNPVDSDQMAQQQAMFAQVEQLMNLNATMETFVASQEDVMLGIASVFNTLESASFLGKDVAFFTNQVVVDEDGSYGSLSYDLGKDAFVGYTIKDASSRTVLSVPQEATEAGEGKMISWDGTDTEGNPVSPGTYTITINVQDAAGVAMTGQTYSEVKVRSIDFRSGTPILTLDDGRKIDVTQILALSDHEGA
ncbi:MAG: hypothetical protein KKH94_13325 [Candidatus Omnitrophica bacterium]|nr:hypothetical protein [Candidatus Omnitrophota bacterium]